MSLAALLTCCCLRLCLSSSETRTYFPFDPSVVMTSEIEEKFQELSASKTVRGVLILNSDGAPVKSSLDAKTTESYSEMMHEIMALSRRLFQNADPSNELTFVRFRTRKHEIMVAPDKKYLLVVLHQPQE